MCVFVRVCVCEWGGVGGGTRERGQGAEKQLGMLCPPAPIRCVRACLRACVRVCMRACECVRARSVCESKRAFVRVRGCIFRVCV